MVSRESQDQSIKARKTELFEEERRVSTVGPIKPFTHYLGVTPAMPLSGATKKLLGAAAVVVMLLFLLAMLTIKGPRARPHHHRPPVAGTPRS